MGLPALGVAIIGAAVAAAGTSAANYPIAPTYAVKCSDSVYQTPANAPPPTFAALTTGPVVFNGLAAHARKQVSPPTKREPFFNVVSFFNVLTTARSGVTIRLVGGNPADRLVAGRVSAAPPQAARAIRFPLCRDHATGARLVTQYGISFLLPKQGCFTVEVQPVGTLRRYRATIPVGVLHC